MRDQLTFKEVRLEVDLEDVAAQALDGVIERKNVDAFTVLDIQAWVDIDHVTELNAKVVAGNLIHLDLALLDVV